MKLRCIKKISAVTMALIFLLSPAVQSSWLFSDTIYTIPESEIEIVFETDFVQVDSFFQREKLTAGIGILPSLSIWLEMSFLHQGAMTFRANRVGDMGLRIWYYIGDYLKDSLHMGFQVRFNFPTGPEVYDDPLWRNLSLGQNEMTPALVFQLDLPRRLFLHINTAYTFRQERNSPFYGGISLNPISGKTWSRVFGLNPGSEGAFFYYKNLKNDYFSSSLVLNTDRFYPLIPAFEVYGSFRPYRGSIVEKDLAIEGGSIDPFLMALHVRFFFSRDVYVALRCAVNPLWQKGYLRGIYGFSCSGIF